MTEIAMGAHATYVHGSAREGWWWGCATCVTTPPNQFVYRRDAERASVAYHREEQK